MAEDGDRVDPARTELTRQRSLDKASDRRVIMTDMMERLRDNAPMGEHAAIRNLMYHAADEIERLSDRIVDLESENEQLRDRIAELDDEVYKLRVAIHHANKEARLLHIVSGRLSDITHQALREGLKDD